jgi:hypothetical protein
VVTSQFLPRHLIAGLILGLTLSSSPCHAQPLDSDSIHEAVHAERQALKGYFDETSKLMDEFKNKKDKLRDANYLMDTINRLQERTGFEDSLLAVYDCVTNVAAQQDAEQRIRELYASLATLTELDVESAASVAHSSKSKELAALAEKVQTEIHKIADRYQSLSKEQ